MPLTAAAVGAVVAALLACAACSGEGGPTAEGPPSVASSSGTMSAAPPSSSCPSAPAPDGPVTFDQELHDELIAMFERDQAGRTGAEFDSEGDEKRTERLKEILAEHGWPGFDLVGEDGEDAAWTIAQHADQDRDFQLCALELLTVAVEAGQGSPGNLAYLADRVAVSGGEPQRYGTQVGCGDDGPEPATPLEDPDAIDEVRAEVGLPPYAVYLEEMTAICSADG